MLRALWIGAWIALAAWSASVKLYLKDGSYHVVREYQVLADRVRYYSLERSDWEEIPLELADLKRTEAESRRVEEQRRQDTALADQEEKAERAARREVARVPQETGAYLVEGDRLTPMKLAESKVVTNKARSVLKVLSPIPIVAGKATVELDGDRSATIVSTDPPEFYIRLAAIERFGLVRLKPQKNSRVVEKLTIVPVTKEIVEEQDQVEVFRKQVDDDLYKIWPMQPLEPGEYAVVEYTEGKLNLRIWDFSYRPAGR